MNRIVFLFLILAIASCKTSENSNADRSDDKEWFSKNRMLVHYFLEEYDRGSYLFDSLMSANVLLEPKFLNVGLEMLHKAGQNQRLVEFFRNFNDDEKAFICSKGWLSQATTGNEDLCSDITIPEEEVSHPQLQRQLAIMFYNDQASRGNVRSDIIEPFNLNEDSISYHEDVFWVDSVNREKLKAIIVEHGFPTKAMVGEVGMESVFFVIQHSDRDVEFQKSQFKYIEEAVKRGDLEGSKYAYLYDRIKVNAGEPQRYGTQFDRIDLENFNAELAPVEDPENLDKRRRELNMMPIDLYKELMIGNIKKNNP